MSCGRRRERVSYGRDRRAAQSPAREGERERRTSCSWKSSTVTAPRWNRTPRRCSVNRLFLRALAGGPQPCTLDSEGREERDAPVAKRARERARVAPVLDGELGDAVLLRSGCGARWLGSSVDLQRPVYSELWQHQRAGRARAAGERESSGEEERRSSPLRRVPRRASAHRLDAQCTSCVRPRPRPGPVSAAQRRVAREHLLTRDEGFAALCEAREALEGARVQCAGQDTRDRELGRHARVEECRGERAKGGQEGASTASAPQLLATLLGTTERGTNRTRLHRARRRNDTRSRCGTTVTSTTRVRGGERQREAKRERETLRASGPPTVRPASAAAHCRARTR